MKEKCITNGTKELKSIYGVQKQINRVAYRAYNSKILHSQCESDCMELNVLPGIQRSEQEYREVYFAVEKKSQSCKERIIHNLVDGLAKERIPKDCLNNDKPVCMSVLKEMNTIQRRVFSLMDLVHWRSKKKSEDEKTEATSVCMSCDKYNSVKKTYRTGSVKDLIQTINNLQCKEILPGTEKVVVSGTEESMNKSYKLRREPDGNYSALLNIEFFADIDYNGEVPREQVPAYYMNKVQSCLQEAGEKLLGPDGEKLQIVVSSPPSSKDQSCKPIFRTIAIRNTGTRSNHLEYAADIDCAAVTHEVLHLLGLPDEYKERSRGYYVNPDTGEVENNMSQVQTNPDMYNFLNAYDCRITKNNSLMSNHLYRWHNVFTHEKEDSLLNPDQFNSILYGTCPERNKIFNECAQLSMKSSVNFPECLEQRSKCRKKLLYKELK